MLFRSIITPLINRVGVNQQSNVGVLKISIGGGQTIDLNVVLSAAINFFLVAVVVYFLVVLPVNTLLAKFRHPVVPPPTTKPCPECLSDIPLAAKRCSHCAQLVA